MSSPSSIDESLWRFVIYRCVTGSRAYGLDREGSDTDRRGFYLPPADRHWSLEGVPEQLENKDTEECYWELGKFIRLALKANPNVLECLYSPVVETMTPLAAGLIGMRAAFLSRLVHQTYSGYAEAQFRKLSHYREREGAIRWKHVMHLIRLLLSGAVVLREGYVPVDVSVHRERLLAIRAGSVPWEEVEAWRLALHRELDAALHESVLAEAPDIERANAFLIRARRFADHPNYRESDS